MAVSEQIPVHDYEVVRGDNLDFNVRYAPGGEPMNWSGGASVSITVRTESGKLFEIGETDIELVAPGDLGDEEEPNIIATLSPEETLQLDDGQRNQYQIQLTDADGKLFSVLTGRIVSRYSAKNNV